MAFDLRVLFASDLEGGSTASADPVVNFAAIVEALDNENTLVLSSGDNWIPGPDTTLVLSVPVGETAEPSMIYTTLCMV